jgi:hypothetical protein
MSIDKAILVCKNYLKCSEVVCISELNTEQFKEALQCLITLVQSEGNGMADK